ncbi:19099_t:CDS:2 [Entrophospora sp. SA101]|nr:9057_t:CDS:2 [Entrophospora sp. SA101]CAJ0832956.1 9059_t:CDS:2 [Entrophospora sp. SA101]CAJ0867878.1 19099_t:CDS:2 [Entrophospora sp. SA101]
MTNKLRKESKKLLKILKKSVQPTTTMTFQYFVNYDDTVNGIQDNNSIASFGLVIGVIIGLSLLLIGIGQSKFINYQNFDETNQQRSIDNENEITKLPTVYVPNTHSYIRNYYNSLHDDKIITFDPSETLSSSSFSQPSPTNLMKPTQTKTFSSIKSLNYTPSTTSPGNEANNNYYKKKETPLINKIYSGPSNQNFSQTVVISLNDYHTNGNDINDNCFDGYYNNINYSEKGKQVEDYYNCNNDTNNNCNNENDNKIKNGNEILLVNIKPKPSKLKSDPYNNHSKSYLSNNEPSSSLQTPIPTIIRPKNPSISDSFKTFPSSLPSPYSNYEKSACSKKFASKLISWTSNMNNNNNKNYKVLTLKQNTDGNSVGEYSASSMYNDSAAETSNADNRDKNNGEEERNESDNDNNNPSVKLPKIPKIIVNKNLSINFERFSLFRNAPGYIDKGYYDIDNYIIDSDSNYRSKGIRNGNNRIAHVYLKPGSIQSTYR